MLEAALGWLVWYFVAATGLGVVLAGFAIKFAVGDLLAERQLQPREPDTSWVAVELLVTAILIAAGLLMKFTAGALVGLARLERLDRDRFIYQLWPFFLGGGMTMGVALLAFRLYGRRHLHQIQQDMELGETLQANGYGEVVAGNP